MIEELIKQNTEAVTALTAAITALVSALQQSTPVQAPVTAPVTAPVQAPASAPVSAPAPAPAQATEQKPLTGDELRKLCVRAGAEGLTDVVVAFLSERGVQKLAQLPQEQYPDLVSLLKSKGVE